MMGHKKLTSYDIHLFHEGKLFRAYEKFGAHVTNENGVDGARFTVWAPQARQVGVAGDFNGWRGLKCPLEKISPSGIWSAFIPGIREGELYKYEIDTGRGQAFMKADPYAFYSEVRPKSASIVYNLDGYHWGDDCWLQKKTPPYLGPLNIYEVHAGSWKRKENGEFLGYRELAHELAAYAREMGYTHLELLPLMEHPFDGSWGYQVTGYYSVTSRYGPPHDFMYFVDYCHRQGIGVILDWVPSHFCRDEHGLAKFDGTSLYEKGESAEWGTFHFDFSKPEVVSFLVSNALFWFEVYHVDGLRLDAVASMLYLDYGRKEGKWRPNKYGGKENLEAIDFLKRLNEAVFYYFPHALMIAEESTAWPLVSSPTYAGGLGFNYKWNMGWMNDILEYMGKDPLQRKWHHQKLTFSLLYAFSENFILPFSHDEVVHGKKSLIEKMPGDYWQKFANLRLLIGFMMTHPGKKLLFMGGEFAQFLEWRFYEELDWKILDFPMHRSFQRYVRELNRFYLEEKTLWENDSEWRGFSWIEADNWRQSVIVFMRKDAAGEDFVVVVGNFTQAAYEKYRIGVPFSGWYGEVFNSDLEIYGGSGRKNPASIRARKVPWQNQPFSVEVDIPPLAVVFLKKQQQIKEKDR
ncbi:MAG: 1,4-alpha-glucan branching protein GlgB [Peptococcaceae bacterium]|jgi:1,4-alpha-glucan branching enzyme|nr:1,4-alpha-glucan branching protein GlgB [Peptococcaceae bacterium]MDH7525670.1 1,4-alpha-glucan branching protein GlgB [Peptococcaceae bacterium]